MIKNDIKVSVLIPVYNCETYLDQCLKSVISQTLRELEIICVDDGSTDNSGKILKNYQEIDRRIVLLQQENQGAGVARNLALKRAKGKYVSFLDADDYLKEENALEIMVDMCRNRKISVCASRKRCLKNEKEEINELFGKDCVGKVLKYKDYQMDFFYQNYLFERKLLIEHQISFPLYRRYQDPPFFARTLFAAKEFTVADTCLYCYRTSLDFNEKFDVQKTEDMLRGMIDNLIFAEENKLDILFCNTADLLETNTAIVKVIYENITSDGLGVLELLLKLNKIISNKCKKYHYVIKPLRLLLFNLKLYKKHLLQTIRMHNEIAIYGAGVYAKGFLNFLNQHEILFMVKNIVVTKMDDNPSHIRGIPVMTLSEFLSVNKKAFLIIAVNEKNGKEIVKYMEEKGCKDYLIIDEIFWEQEIN